MSCTLFIRWVSLAMLLLSTVVLVTDSCSSTLRSFRRRETVLPITTTAELPTTSEMTTETITFIPLTEAPEYIEDKLSPKNQYDHITYCNDTLKDVYCFNGGTCYTHNYNLEGELAHCECQGDFYGEQCQYKALEGRYGGGLALSKKKRSIRRSNDTAVSQSESKPRKHRRRGRQAINKKDKRSKTTDAAAA